MCIYIQNIVWTGFGSLSVVKHTNVYPLVAVDGSVAQTVGSLQVEAEEGARRKTGHSEGPTLLVVRCWWILHNDHHRSTVDDDDDDDDYDDKNGAGESYGENNHDNDENEGDNVNDVDTVKLIILIMMINWS